ncbi:hypothetical protein K9L97_05055 [Candidatus Woesearchaeota archaeon]|nr:hypothetical protein [Candidatus Woesearchaeota archaeon]
MLNYLEDYHHILGECLGFVKHIKNKPTYVQSIYNLEHIGNFERVKDGASESYNVPHSIVAMLRETAKELNNSKSATESFSKRLIMYHKVSKSLGTKYDSVIINDIDKFVNKYAKIKKNVDDSLSIILPLLNIKEIISDQQLKNRAIRYSKLKDVLFNTSFSFVKDQIKDDEDNLLRTYNFLRK